MHRHNAWILKMAVLLLLLLCGLALWIWGSGAIWFQGPSQSMLRWTLMGLWTAWMLGSLVAYWTSQRPAMLMACWLLSFVALMVWWQQIKPSDTRDWAADVARHTQVEVVRGPGQRVSVSNVRNFRWRTDADFDARWEQRSYDLSRLNRVDVALSYWMGPSIAHTLVSFGFSNGEHLVFSIEIRKERGEQFDALAGFFKRYEMVLVAADERDILGVRTNARGEKVHLYQVDMPQQAMRDLFMAYAQQADELVEQPRFYNTLTANCTTIVWQLARSIGAKLPMDWRMLASGYLPSYLQSFGVLAPHSTLEALEQAGNITERAKAWTPPSGSADIKASIDFSKAIREGMPALH